MPLADDNCQEDYLGSIGEAQIAAALHDVRSLPAAAFAAFGRLTLASVLIPFLHMDDGWHILFTRRTDRVERHKGQVAFPGGSMDKIDRNPVDTALRETF